MGRRIWFAPLLCLAVGCASKAYETRPFFQREYGVEAHGRKTVFDHLVEMDPGSFKVSVAADYLKTSPARIAILPFTDLGSANFVVDKVPLTFRNKDRRANWAWTDAQRLRRAFDGICRSGSLPSLIWTGSTPFFASAASTPPQSSPECRPSSLASGWASMRWHMAR
jgi:hypothetical protein